LHIKKRANACLIIVRLVFIAALYTCTGITQSLKLAKEGMYGDVWDSKRHQFTFLLQVSVPFVHLNECNSRAPDVSTFTLP